MKHAKGHFVLCLNTSFRYWNVQSAFVYLFRSRNTFLYPVFKPIFAGFMPTRFSVYSSYFKQILKLSYPIVIGQLGIVMMGVADVIMIGRLGSSELAASSFANAVYFMTAILGIGTMTAVSPLISASHAAGKPDEVSAYYRQGIKAAIILSIAIIGINQVVASQMHLFGQSNEIWEPAKGFYQWLTFSTLPLMLFLAAKQFSDGLSFTLPSAVITIIALTINVFLNWLLIYGNAGAPKIGLKGAAYATFIARVFMAITMILYVRLSPKYAAYRFAVDLSKYKRMLRQIFSVGLPSGLQYFFEVGAFAFAAIMIGWIGKAELAAHQVAINIASVTYMLATGISAGGSIAVGDAFGRKNREDIIRAGNAALILGTAFMGLSALGMILFNEQIIAWYTQDSSVGYMASGLLWIAALFQLSDGLQCVSLGVLRGITDTKMPTVITIIAYWVIGIPVGYYLGFHRGMSLYGIWYALLAALTFSAIMLLIRFRRESLSMQFDSNAHVG